MYRSHPLIALIAVIALAGSSSADPIPVFTVQIDGAVPPPWVLQYVAQAAGRSALWGVSLAREIEQRIGSAAVEGDPLAPVRSWVQRGVMLYYRGPLYYARAERLLATASTALEADQPTRYALSDNRVAFSTAAFIRARIALEHHDRATAEALMRALARRDPLFEPSEREFPPDVAALYHRALSAVSTAAGPHGQLRILARGDLDCVAQLDGHELGNTPMALVVLPGVHFATIRCGTVRSRWHTVLVPAGGAADVTIDPRLDRTLYNGPPVALRYASVHEANELLRADLAIVGRALGAQQVIAVAAADEERGASIAVTSLPSGAVTTWDTLPSMDEIHAVVTAGNAQ